jgi:hypothetical protein
MDEVEFQVPWDEGALRIVGQIERSIVRLNLNSQAEFVSFVNAIEVHLEYGAVDVQVLRHLTDAFRALASARDLDRKKLKLDARLDSLLRRFAPSTPT